MSQRLIKAGFSVTVYNRSKEKEEVLKSIGASVASSPKILIEQVDIVFIMVTDDHAIRKIFAVEVCLAPEKREKSSLI
ncbi:MAG TPA: NAD(P)-binding domain-containing protein [Puia sp.]|nr:NAD(P)-binding domain-containing protein [Puia sp.]